MCRLAGAEGGLHPQPKPFVWTKTADEILGKLGPFYGKTDNAM